MAENEFLDARRRCWKHIRRGITAGSSAGEVADRFSSEFYAMFRRLLKSDSNGNTFPLQDLLRAATQKDHMKIAEIAASCSKGREVAELVANASMRGLSSPIQVMEEVLDMAFDRIADSVRIEMLNTPRPFDHLDPLLGEIKSELQQTKTVLAKKLSACPQDPPRRPPKRRQQADMRNFLPGLEVPRVSTSAKEETTAQKLRVSLLG